MRYGHGGLRYRGFNPRPRGRGRLAKFQHAGRHSDVSIHAPVGGGDPIPANITMTTTAFQSTPPWEGATRAKSPGRTWWRVSIHAPVGGGDHNDLDLCLIFAVSIHAPVGGGDLWPSSGYTGRAGFNPRPRGRGRQPAGLSMGTPVRFQSTPPWEGATT